MFFHYDTIIVNVNECADAIHTIMLCNRYISQLQDTDVHYSILLTH